MDINEAMDKINQIHAHLSRSEMYKGYRPKTLFWVGTLSFLIMIAEQLFFPDINPAYVWIGAAILIMIYVFGNIAIHYFGKSESFQKKQTKNISLQFLPGMLAGVLITVYFIFFESNILLLPGLWAYIFGLTILGLIPYITRMLIFTVLFYIACGTLLLLGPRYGFPVFPYGMGLTFGLGHWLSALIMKSNLRQFDE